MGNLDTLNSMVMLILMHLQYLDLNENQNQRNYVLIRIPCNQSIGNSRMIDEMLKMIYIWIIWMFLWIQIEFRVGLKTMVDINRSYQIQHRNEVIMAGAISFTATTARK